MKQVVIGVVIAVISAALSWGLSMSFVGNKAALQAAGIEAKVALEEAATQNLKADLEAEKIALKADLDAERAARRESEATENGRMDRVTGLMEKLIEQNSQLLTLLRVQNQLLPKN